MRLRPAARNTTWRRIIFDHVGTGTAPPKFDSSRTLLMHTWVLPNFPKQIISESPRDIVVLKMCVVWEYGTVQFGGCVLWQGASNVWKFAPPSSSPINPVIDSRGRDATSEGKNTMLLPNDTPDATMPHEHKNVVRKHNVVMLYRKPPVYAATLEGIVERADRSLAWRIS